MTASLDHPAVTAACLADRHLVPAHAIHCGDRDVAVLLQNDEARCIVFVTDTRDGEWITPGIAIAGTAAVRIGFAEQPSVHIHTRGGGIVPVPSDR